MSIEAMKQSLEALEKYCDQAAIDNMRQAIEQAEKQEPVAWMEMVVANLVRNGINKHMARELAHHFYTYTAPPRKKWVGLDDEDWMNVPDFQKEGCELDAAIYDWIEARLKEKNT